MRLAYQLQRIPRGKGITSRFFPTCPLHTFSTVPALTRVFGTGIDLAHIPRFETTLSRYGDRFLNKALHATEISELKSIPEVPDGPRRRATFLASRWAAKEAFTKAVGARLLFPEMRVGKPSSGPPAPVLMLEGEALAYVLGKELKTHLTLSHDGDYATAMVVLEQQVDLKALLAGLP